MALTEFQITVLRLIIESRGEEAGGYIAGGAALNQLLRTPRRSHDLDLFHDTTEALRHTWDNDRTVLLEKGYTVTTLRDAPSFVEAEIERSGEHVLIQWVRDSAYRFFPLVKDDVLGVTLHPVDLATNKVLAMAGRLEPRDWIDTIECHARIQQLGYLIWAACGKDPGINPDMLLSDAARLHYTQDEINILDFDGETPSAAVLSEMWKKAVVTAKELIALMPEDHLGECILADNDMPYKGTPMQFSEDLSSGKIKFHKGTIKGVWPQVAGE